MPLKIVWRSGRAHAHGTLAGERVRKALGTADPARAEELRAQLEARLWKRHSYGEEAVRSFDDAALSYLKAGGERRFLLPLARHFRGRALGSIRPGEIRAAAQALYPGRSAATWNRQAIVPARAVINHAAALGWCAPLRVEVFPVKRAKRVAVGRDWIDAFLAAADQARLFHAAAALLFMHQTGARISETVRLTAADVDLHARTATLVRTKESAFERRHLTRELVIRIANLPPVKRRRDARSYDRPLFGYASRFTLAQAIRRICRRAGLAPVPPHQAGRHSAATNALAAGFSVREVMDAFGWKTARMLLETYAHTEAAGARIAAHFDGDTGTGLTQRLSQGEPKSRRRNAKS